MRGGDDAGLRCACVTGVTKQVVPIQATFIRVSASSRVQLNVAALRTPHALP